MLVQKRVLPHPVSVRSHSFHKGLMPLVPCRENIVCIVWMRHLSIKKAMAYGLGGKYKVDIWEEKEF